MTFPTPPTASDPTSGMNLKGLLGDIKHISSLQQRFDRQMRPYAGHHIVPGRSANESGNYKLLNNLGLDYHHNSVDHNLIPMSQTPKGGAKTGMVTPPHNGRHPEFYFKTMTNLALKPLETIYDNTIGKHIPEIEDLPNKMDEIAERKNQGSLTDKDLEIIASLREYSRKGSRHIIGVNSVVAGKIIDQSTLFVLQYQEEKYLPQHIVEQFKKDNPDTELNQPNFSAWQKEIWDGLKLEDIKADPRYLLSEKHGLSSISGFDQPENSAGHPDQYNSDRTTAGYDEWSRQASQKTKQDFDNQYGEGGRDGANLQFSFDRDGNPSVDINGNVATVPTRPEHIKSINYERSQRLSHFARGGTIVAVGLLAGMVASAKATAMHLNEMALDPSFEWTMLDVLEAGGIDTSVFSEDFLEQLVQDMAVDAGIQVASRAIPFVGLALSAYDLIITAIAMPDIYSPAKAFIASQVRLTVGSAQHKFYRKSLNVLNIIEAKLGFEPDRQPPSVPYWDRDPSPGDDLALVHDTSSTFTLPPLVEVHIPSLLEPSRRQALLNRLDRLAAAEGVDRETFLRRKLGVAAGEDGNVESAEAQVRFVENLLGVDLSEEEAQAFHDLEDLREEAQVEAGEIGTNPVEDHYHHSTGYQIGGMLGSIGKIFYDQFGGDSVAVGLAISAVGQTIGQFAGYYAEKVLRDETDIPLPDLTWANFGKELLRNSAQVGISYGSGLFTDWALGGINFGDGLGGQLARQVSYSVVQSATTYAVNTALFYLGAPPAILPANFNPSVGSFLDGGLNAGAGAVGSWAGSTLAKAVFKDGNPVGMSVGGAIGSIVGSTILAGTFTSLFAFAGAFAGPIGAMLGAFIGTLVGSLVGGLFGGSPGKPRAISYVVWTGEDFVAFGTYEENGGSGRIAARMADAAAKAMRSVLTLTGGTLDQEQTNVRIGFGHEKDYYVNTYLPKDWDRHYKSSQVNVEVGVIRQMKRYRIIGGDPYVKRALMRDNDYRLEPLYKSMAVAVEYSTYMDNPALYEQEIARIRGEDPDLAAGHAAMLARAAELKLDTPLWYEFRANPVDDSVTAWDGVSDLTVEDAGEATRVQDDHTKYWYDARTGGGSDVVTLPAGVTIKDLIFRVDGTDLLVLRRGAGADLAAQAASASATLRLSRWFDPEFRIETLRFADGSELYLPAVINGSADLLAGELFDGAWFDADRTGTAFEALPGPVAADSLVVVDLDGDGIAWLEGSEVRFDIDGDGYAERVDWIGPSDGLLVIDRDGNGRIDDGSELLSAMFAPSEAGTGLTALHSLNDNGDGVLDARDAAWQDLRIWRDNNQNGIVDLGELQALFRYDIDALSLAVLAAPGRHDAGHDPRILAQTAALQVGRSAATGLALYDVRLDYDADGVRQETWRGAGGATWTLFTFEAKDNIAVLAGDGAITEQVDAATAGIFTAGRGDDVLTVAPGSAGVKINAGAGDDTVVGGAGDDWLVGGAGRDSLAGGAGDDTLVVDDADMLAEIDAGDGRDTVIFEGSNAVILDLSTIGAEVAVGGRGNDHLWNDNPAAVTAKAPAGDARDGGHPALELAGGAGDDTLIGTGGVDRLDGGADDDSLAGGAGDDTIIGGLGSDRLHAGAGDDEIHIDAEDARALAGGWDLDAGAGRDRLVVIGDGGVSLDLAAVNAEDATGGAGNDRLSAWGVAAGGSTLAGGAGNDSLEGGSGADSLDGGGGDGDKALYSRSAAAVTVDLVHGTAAGGMAAGDRLAGIEHLVGSGFADTLIGTAGDNSFAGGAGDDSIDGGRGRDSVSYAGAVAGVTVDLAAGTAAGGGGRDVLRSIDNAVGSDWADRLVGGDGNNMLTGGGGGDTLIGGIGDDLIDYSASDAGVRVDLLAETATGGHASGDSLSAIEAVIGSRFDDILSGTRESNLLVGGDGFDYLVGRSGDDTLDGGAGGGTQFGASGDDVLTAGGGDDTLLGGTGDDDLVAGDGTNSLSGGDGADRMAAGSGTDTLLGGGGGDLLKGGAGSDSLSGGAGNDYLAGGLGRDTIAGGAGVDTISFEDLVGAVTVDIAAQRVTVAPAAGAGTDTPPQDDLFSGIENAVGGQGADSLLGDAGANVLYGIDGNDSLGGGGGTDTLSGGRGDDTLSGGGGGDRILFGADSGRDRLLDGGADDQVWFAAGVTADDVMFRREKDDLTVSVHGSEAVLTLVDWYKTAASGRLDRFRLADGTAVAIRLRIDGEADAETLTGTDGGDVINGGRGDDTVDGGLGDDIYLFDRHDGRDVIRDSGGHDRLLFTDPDLTAADLDVRLVGRDLVITVIDAARPAEIFVTRRERIVLEDWLTGAGRIESVQFADGSAWSVGDLIAAAQSDSGDAWTWDGGALTVDGGGGNDSITGGAAGDRIDGGAGADSLVGGDGADTLAGGAGNDSLDGNGGADRFRLSANQGDDRISDSQGGLGDGDVIELAADIDVGAITWRRAGGDLVATFAEGGSVTAVGVYAASGIGASVDGLFEQGGSAVTVTDIEVTGTAASETVYGTVQDDVMRSGGGTDRLRGGAGDDTYRYDRGDGRVTVAEDDGAGGRDRVVFGAGITAADLSWRRTGSYNLEITVAGGGTLVIENQYYSPTYQIDGGFWLADGTAIGSRFIGTDAGETLYGLASGDSLDGGGGNDVLYGRDGDDTLSGGGGSDTLYGQAGDDTYLYNRGDGRVMVDDHEVGSHAGGSRDRVLFGAGIAVSDLVFSLSGIDLYIGLPQAGEAGLAASAMANHVRIRHWHYDNRDRNVEIVELTDGTILTIGDVAARLGTAAGETLDLREHDDYALSLDGGGGNDTLYSADADDTLLGGGGNDVLNGAAGNDSLLGGAGDDTLNGGGDDDTLAGGGGTDRLRGETGDDTYLYRRGDGRVTVAENDGSGGRDRVVFGAGITAADLNWRRSGNNLEIAVAGGDTLVIENQYHSPTYQIDGGFWLADGTAVRGRFIGGDAGETLHGLATGDSLDGGGGNDTLRAGGGNDTLTGGAGSDVLLGQAGDDTYVYNRGDGIVTIRDHEAGSHKAGSADRLRFGAGIALSDLRFTLSGSHLVIGLPQAGEATLSPPAIANRIQIDHWNHANKDHLLETIELADGTVLTLADVIARLGGDGGDSLDLRQQDGIAMALNAGGGSDMVHSGSRSDTLSGGDGADRLYSHAGADSLDGGAGNDVLHAGAGNDTLAGGGGTDRLRGEAGDDTYLYNRGDGRVTVAENDGSGGRDRVVFGAGITAADLSWRRDGGYNLEITVAGGGTLVIENQYYSPTYQIDGGFWLADGTAVHGRFIGGDAGETLYGLASGDSLDGGGGNDVLYGRDGDDTLSGGGGSDTLYGQAGDDTYLYNRGDGRVMVDDHEVGSHAGGSRDRVLFGAGIAVSDLVFSLSGIDLYIGLPQAGEAGLAASAMANHVRIRHWHYDNRDRNVEIVELADGTILTIGDVAARLGTAAGETLDLREHDDYALSLDGGGGNDTLYSADADDTLLGGGGNDVLNGAAGNDSLLGGAGDDTLNGGGDDDTLAGGGGTDRLRGEAGDDTYLYRRGDGRVTVAENDGSGGRDRVVFGVGITAADLNWRRSGNNLEIAVAGGDTLVIENQYYSPTYQIDGGFWLADGTAVRGRFIGGDAGETLHGLATGDSLDGGAGNDVLHAGAGADSLFGGAGDDTLNGGGDDDTLAGGGGTDRLRGEAGDDTYLYNRGDGRVTVAENDGSGGRDRVVFGAGITAADLNWRRSGSYNLEITVAGGGTLVIENQYYSPTYQIDGGFWLADGTAVHGRFIGGDAGETLYGLASGDSLDGGGGNDVLYGRDGDDTLSGGGGSDTLYGQAGDDTYLYNRGDGRVMVDDHEVGSHAGGSRDRVLFGAGIAVSDLVFSLSGIDLYIGLPQAGEAGLAASAMANHVRIRHWHYDNRDRNVEIVELTDGTILTIGDVAARLGTAAGETLDLREHDDYALSLDGGGGNDTLYSADADDTLLGGGGNDVLNGAAGNDSLLGGAGDDTLNGGDDDDTLAGGGGTDRLRGEAGDDTYLYRRGDGRVTVAENDGSGGRDRVVFGAGITAADLNWRRSGNNLEIAVAGGDTLVIENQYYSPTYQIDGGFWLANGTAVHGRFIGGDAGETLYGTSSSDSLFGGAGDDTLNGGADDDTLAGGGGTDRLRGETGDDTYLYNRGDGRVTVAENDGSGGRDRVVFGAGITAADLSWYRDGGGYALEITVAGGGTLVIENQYHSRTYQIDGGFWLADGTAVHGRFIGTAAGDSLYGTDLGDSLDGGGGSDILRSGGGDDTLTGGGGSDVLLGQAGDDIYVYNRGDGFVTIQDYEAGSHAAGSGDRLRFGAGIALSDLRFALNGPHLVIGLPRAGEAEMSPLAMADRVQLDYWAGSDRDYLLETIELADGTVLTPSDVIARFTSDGDDRLDLSSLAGHGAAGGGFAMASIGGGAGDDTLSGGVAAVSLSGGRGDDVLTAGRGGATLSGGTGSDSLVAGSGRDVVLFEAGSGTDMVRLNDGAAADGDQIVLGAGVTAAAVIASRSGDDLILYRLDDGGGSGDVLRVQNWYQGAAWQADGGIVDQSGAVVVETALAFWQGSAGSDRLTGTSASDHAVGGAGHDSLDGAAGDDVLIGETGRDSLAGGAGGDLLRGGAEHDSLAGGAGADTLYGGTESDSLDGGAGDDSLVAGAGRDVILLGWNDGDDVLADPGWRDRIVLDAGVGADDVRFRRRGDDLVVAVLAPEAGSDSGSTLTLTGWFSDREHRLSRVDLAGGGTVAVRIETLGTAGADSLVGADPAGRLEGLAGNDLLSGGGGDDLLIGGAGDDTLSGGGGHDIAVIAAAVDSSGAGSGADRLLDFGGDDRIELAGVSDAGAIDFARRGDDLAIVSHGVTVAVLADWFVQAAADRLADVYLPETGIMLPIQVQASGTTGADTLIGGDWATAFDGGAGTDRIELGSGRETVRLSPTGGHDRVTGFAAGDVLVAGPGLTAADLSFGRRGDDLVIAVSGPGSGAAASVTLDGWFAAPDAARPRGVIRFEDGASPIGFRLDSAGTAGADSLVGGAWNDSLSGGAGNDTLVGGGGANTLRGGGGGDRFVVDAADRSIDILADAGAADTLVLTNLDAAADVRFVRSGTDLLVLTGDDDDGGGGIAVALSDWLVQPASARLSRVERDDGTALSLVVEDSGSAGGDVLGIGDWSGRLFGLGGADTLTGGSQSDTLDGGTGADSLVAGGGADLVVFRGGGGSDVWQDATNADRLRLRGTLDRVAVTIDGADLVAHYVLTGDSIRVVGGAALTGGFVIEVQDGDDEAPVVVPVGAGAVIGSNLGEALTGTAAGEQLAGRWGDDTLNGGGGDDSLAGGPGSDRIVLASGGGADRWLDADAGDVLVLGAGRVVRHPGGADGTPVETIVADLTAADATFTRSGDDLVVTVTDGSSVTVDGWFVTAAAERLSAVELADGTAVDLRVLQTGGATAAVLRGGDGLDRLQAGSAGDSLDGGAGRDQLVGGAGADRFMVSLHGGTDTVSGATAADSILLDHGITAADLHAVRHGDALLLAHANGRDGVQIDDWFALTAGNRPAVLLADGTALAVSLVTGGTQDSDTLSGGAADARLLGLGGDDSLSGGGTAETLDGGAGHDTLASGGGDDVLRGGAGGDAFVMTAGMGSDRVIDATAADRILLGQDGDGVDLTADRVRFARDGRDLVGRLVDRQGTGTGETLRLRGWFDRKLSQRLMTVRDAAGNAIVLRVDQIGTAGADRIGGHAWHDRIEGGAGADTLSGGGGRDVLSGGDGADRLDGGAGDDVLTGGAGADLFVYGAPDRDMGAGRSAGTDTAGTDVITDAEASDSILLTGRSRRDVLFGRNKDHLQIGFVGSTGGLRVENWFADGVSGPDHVGFDDGSTLAIALSVIGTAAADSLPGSDGDQHYYLQGGADSVDGGAGTDRVVYLTATAGVHVDLASGTGKAGDADGDRYRNIENVTGGGGDDTLTGDGGANLLEGAGGGDVLDGKGGHDTASYLVTWDQVMLERDGGSHILTHLAEDGAAIDEGRDRLTSIETLSFLDGDRGVTADQTGTAAADSLTAGAGGALVWAGAGADSITGGAGADRLAGEAGDDVLSGGGGDDILSGGSGRDMAVYAGAMANYRLDYHASHLVLRDLVGSDGSDRLIGIETLRFSDGMIDLASLEAGSDTAGDRLDAVATGGLLFGRGGDDSLTGGAGNDLLDGGAGDDSLTGGAGADSLDGGAGDDSFAFGRGDGADSLRDSGGTDAVLFQAGIRHDQLWFARTGDDLTVSVIGTADRLTVTDWFGTANPAPIETMTLASGHDVTAAQVNSLVTAMAAYAPPGNRNTDISGHTARLQTDVNTLWGL